MTEEKLLKAVEKLLDGKLDEKISSLKQSLSRFETDIKDEIKGLKDEIKGLKARQDEMYSLLRGWEEDKTLMKSKLDKLDIDVGKLKHHRHKIVIDTQEAESAG